MVGLEGKSLSTKVAEESICYYQDDFGTVYDIHLHHFSDISQLGLGQCSYLRLVSEQGNVHYSLVMTKARGCP